MSRSRIVGSTSSEGPVLLACAVVEENGSLPKRTFETILAPEKKDIHRPGFPFTLFDLLAFNCPEE